MNGDEDIVYAVPEVSPCVKIVELNTAVVGKLEGLRITRPYHAP